MLVRSYCIESDQKNWQTLFIHYCYLFFIAIFFQYLRSGTFKGSFLAIKVERNSNKALSTYLVLPKYAYKVCPNCKPTLFVTRLTRRVQKVNHVLTDGSIFNTCNYNNDHHEAKVFFKYLPRHSAFKSKKRWILWENCTANAIFIFFQSLSKRMAPKELEATYRVKKKVQKTLI